MESLELNNKIRGFFLDYQFKEIPSVPIFTSSPFHNPNFLSLLSQARSSENYLAFSNNLDVKLIPFLPKSNKNDSLFRPTVAGTLSNQYSVTKFVNEFFKHLLDNEKFYWETREKNFEDKMLGFSIYGWELYLDGARVGMCGYLHKLANRQIEDTLVFNLNLQSIYGKYGVKDYNLLEKDFPQYLMHYSSKRVLFELFDNYLEEFIYCVKNDLSSSALVFMAHACSVYELLIIRGFISKTEKIGYDRKMNQLFQKCIETKIGG